MTGHSRESTHARTGTGSHLKLFQATEQFSCDAAVVKPPEEKFSYETGTLKEKERKIEKERERGIIEQPQVAEQQRSLLILLSLCWQVQEINKNVALVFVRFS